MTNLPCLVLSMNGIEWSMGGFAAHETRTLKLYQPGPVSAVDDRPHQRELSDDQHTVKKRVMSWC